VIVGETGVFGAGVKISNTCSIGKILQLEIEPAAMRRRIFLKSFLRNLCKEIGIFIRFPGISFNTDTLPHCTAKVRITFIWLFVIPLPVWWF
jgi:hypothetical protein